MFMCGPHWRKLPKKFKDAIWREYRAGQEIRKDPTPAYLAVQQLAISRSAFKPNDEQAALVCAGYLQRAVEYQQLCIDAGGPDPLEGLIDPTK